MKFKLLSCLLGLLILSGCALQKDYIALQGRITLLEDELLKSQSVSKELKQNATKKGARLDNRFDLLEEEIHRLRGTLEESNHLAGKQAKERETMMRATDEVKAHIADLSKRLANLESYTGYEASPSQKEPQPVASTAQASYNAAKKIFDAGDLDAARRAFEKVVKKHPKSDMADNAQFWIGEVYYKQKWYQKAILEYQKVIEEYPKGNKVPAAYLKQGLAFQSLGEKDNAILILNELVRKFPDSAEASIARKKYDL